MESNRSYISYSQKKLFKTSKKAYYEKYGLGQKSHSTKYQNFGKKLMEDLEFNENVTNYPKELRNIINTSILEYEITYHPKEISKDIYSIIDAVTPDKSKFWEVKTGKHPWDSATVLKDEQILFYATTIFKTFGVIPKAYLVWAETKDSEDMIEFTGKVKVFPRTFTEKELESYYMEVLRTCIEIDEYEHSVVDLEKDKDVRLLKLLAKQKEVEGEIDLLKAEILVDMRNSDKIYSESENFNITVCKRVNWEYSSKLKETAKKTTQEIKLLKATEEKNGVAKKKVTEYLLIKIKK